MALLVPHQVVVQLLLLLLHHPLQSLQQQKMTVSLHSHRSCLLPAHLALAREPPAPHIDLSRMTQVFPGVPRQQGANCQRQQQHKALDGRTSAPDPQPPSLREPPPPTV